MSSNVTLTSSMRNVLSSLQNTTQLMDRSAERLSTGKKVNSALDNPANFFAAKGHLEKANILSGLKDNIGEGIQTVKAADNAVKGIQTMVETMRGTLTQMRTADAPTKAALVTQYNGLVEQLNGFQVDAGYKGVNFLDASSSLTVNFNETGSTKLTATGFNGTSAGLGIVGGSASGVGGLTDLNVATGADISAVEASLNTALTTLRTESSKLSSNLNVMSTRNSFITDMVNTLNVGAEKLVNADMNEEGANLSLLQTRQQLATTSLSLASQAAQSVLRLF